MQSVIATERSFRRVKGCRLGNREGEREGRTDRGGERDRPVNSSALYAETSTVVAKNSRDEESYAPTQKKTSTNQHNRI